MYTKIFFLITIIAAANAAKKSYDGYKLYKVTPNTENQVDILNDIEKRGVGEFWDVFIGVNNEAKVMVAQDKLDEFLSLVNGAQIENSLLLSDLKKAIEDQMKSATTNRDATESFYNMTWNRYHSLEEIYTWLEELASNYPDTTEIVTWGRTTENREMKGIIINLNKDRVKPKGVIESALHAREWIAPATVTWIIKEFLTSDDPAIKEMAEDYEWHILPVANPDGYVYSFTDNRMWRKNRNTIYNRTCSAAVDDDLSNGVDLNRNFGYMWMEIGASNDPCTNTFAGSAAFSEAESRAIVNYVQGLASDGEIIHYLAFHSYTQLVVVPYSHLTSTEQILLEKNNYADAFEIGVRAAAKLEERFGTRYRVGLSTDVLYPMSGTSFDWVKHDINVPVCYLIELRDLGEYGFLLPPEQIIPNNLEIMDFLKELDRSTKFLGYYPSALSRTNRF